MENDTTTDIAVKDFTADTSKDFTSKANKLGADQDLVNLYNAGVFNKDTPTVPDTTTEPTISNFGAPSNDNAYDTAFNQYYQDTQNVDENKIRSNVLKQFQGEINATKNSYGQLLNEVKLQGQGRLGEDTAIQARRGLLGSSFGAAQTDKTRAYNVSENDRVLQSQAAAIAAINARAMGFAQDEITAKRLAKSQGSEAMLANLKSKPERVAKELENLANAFLLQNKDPMSLDKTELENIAKGYGVTTNDIINSYLGRKETKEKEDAEALAEGAFNLSEGQARYQYNPETGQVEEVASKGKTYAPKTGGTVDTGGAVYNGKVLTSSQKTAVDNLDAVATSLSSYKQLYNNLVSASGVNLTGSDAGQLAGSYNALIFQIAQAAGTGALQAADREVVEAMIPNPTTLSGGLGSAVKGGKEGGKKAIDEAALIFANKRNAILGEAPVAREETKSVQQLAEEAGYDYAQMKADGLSDAQIRESL